MRLEPAEDATAPAPQAAAQPAAGTPGGQAVMVLESNQERLKDLSWDLI